MRAPSGLCVTTGADDRRLIEDYLPPDVLNAIASKEKLHPRRYVELVHYWPTRRPITASRAAVYAALLVVEGVSDLLYIQTVSALLEETWR